MTTGEQQAPLVVTELDSVVVLLDLIRTGVARTRPELSRLTGLGRNVVAQRTRQLVATGLVAEGPLAQSTGGRSARELRFVAEAGHLLVAELGATSIGVALSDLTGNLIAEREEPGDVSEGPDVVLGRVDEMFREMLEQHPESVVIWGVGIGLPGPVEFRTGQPVAPPIMPGWDGFKVREFFAHRYDAPVWVDNDVNLMALGELRGGVARQDKDVVYLKIGTGIGAGLVSDGRLHRGAQGCAGDIGHVAVDGIHEVVCRCGKIGCLEALAGGAALARDARAAAEDGRSAALAAVLETNGVVTAADVANAARRGDPVSHQLLATSATLVGEALSRIVSFFNPSLVLVGGGVAEAGDAYLASIRQTVFSRSLPLATRHLKILPSALSDHSGLVGAALMVVEELMSRQRLGRWIERGTTAGMPELVDG
jgi:glucokinase-like ROK family protein